MKKLRLFLTFALMLATVLCVTSCTQDILNAVMGTQSCTVHRDINRDSVCDVCGAEMPVSCRRHEDLDHDGVCDTKGCGTLVKVVHFDDDHDGMCDELYCTHDGMYFEHVDDNYDRVCDDCDAEIEIDCECYDDDEDGYCDECEYPIIICEHRDRNKDDICDKCKEPMPAPPVCNHKDGDKNGLCELCKEPMPGTITLVDGNGKTSYKFVLGKGFGGSVRRKIEYLANELDDYGVPAEINEGEAVDYEIIFGEVTGRDAKYSLDAHDYGVKGYAIKIIDTKIIIIAGSDAAYTEAVDLLRTEYFGINDKIVALGELKSVYVYSDAETVKIQDDYKINHITLFGEDIRSYKIAYDEASADTKNAATQLQKLLYEKAGYWLETAKTSELTAEDKVISFGLVEKCGENGFAATFEAGKITFTSEYITSIKKVPYDFFLDMLENTEDENKTLALTAASASYDRFTKNAHFVYYDDFGAVGDGIVNDADAIYDAHQFAASGDHKKIIGTPGKTYLIGEISAKNACPIKCDVEWTDVKFILDDREGVITNDYRGSVFSVTGSSSTSVTPSNNEFLKAINEAGGFKASDMEKFDLGLGYAAMLFVTNGNHKNFIRYGVNSNSGTTQTEIILIDAEGNIDPRVRFLFDYEKVTHVRACRVDTNTIKPITINGGEFTTKAHNQTASTTYTGQRGIIISRAHVTMKNVKHYVTGEPDSEKGSAYPNFVDVQNAYNVLIEDCVFTGHKTYYNIKGTNKVGLGTYDLTTHTSLEVTFKNCTQSNFYNDPTDPSKGRPSQYWGIGGGGESKRVTYDGCTLSRFDAHTGIMHAYIINSTVGSIDLTGGGNLHVINSKVYGTPMIRFREDYGAFWIGDVVIKDSSIVDSKDNETVQFFNTSWANHYFGYETSMPTSITIDNFSVLKTDEKTISTTAKNANFFSTSFVNESDKYNAARFREQQADGSYAEVDNKNIMTPPGQIIVKNNKVGLKYNFAIFEGKEYFKDTYLAEIPIGEIPECTSHTDADGDYLCDTCGEYMSALVCPIHPDTDHDGVCDVLSCKAKIEE